MDVVTLSVRYYTSMSYALDALGHAYTTKEKKFAIIAEYLRDVILGLVASVITTISMSLDATDNETNLKLAKLAKWMRKQKLPSGLQMQALRHFHELWTAQTSIDISDVLAQCPPAMESTICERLYGPYISHAPMFKGLSAEIIQALCMQATPLFVTKAEAIVTEGQHGTEMYFVLSGTHTRTCMPPCHNYTSSRTSAYENIS